MYFLCIRTNQKMPQFIWIVMGVGRLGFSTKKSEKNFLSDATMTKY